MRRPTSRAAVLAGILVCLAGCGHDAGDHGHSAHQADHQDHDPGSQLTLNDGEKWQVDEPTRASAARLAELVDGAGEVHSIAGARALGQALDQELDLLVRQCTMTGPAHDQLHVFLVALLPQVAALQEQTEVEDLERARDEIGSLLEAYGQHFE